MNYRLVHPRDLTPDDLARWSDMQSACAEFRSPYFRPEFAQLVGRLRPRARVAVLQTQGDPIGFFPIHLDSRGAAGPLAGTLTDFQGLIAAPDTSVDFPQLLRGSRLAAWRFDHLLTSQARHVAQPTRFADSPYLELSDGFAAYAAARQAAGSKIASRVRQMVRKLEREIGPVRLAFHEPGEEATQFVIRSKIEQYHRIASVNHLAPDWTRALLSDIRDFQSEAFAGVLSVLYAGDRLAAAHLGMRSRDTLHYWYPAHHADFEKYSPGLVLLEEVARAAADQGITRIDLGKGDEPYKARFASDVAQVAEGTIDLRPIAGPLCRGLSAARAWVRQSPLRTPAEQLVRGMRTWRRRTTAKWNGQATT
ncbi:MAG: GNAT family N-acetyltransferase [Planctomycetales bacterium]|nr:GNAT family N-acetyltransferase [Planctomycetales bacterium]